MFVKGGRLSSSSSWGNFGARGLAWKEEEGGADGGGRSQEGFLETVTHCSLTPLALGGKDHEVLDIHQPAEEGRLTGARACFLPPFFSLSPCQWDSVRLCRGSRPEETDLGQCK